jgi:hypothetical protein
VDGCTAVTCTDLGRPFRDFATTGIITRTSSNIPSGIDAGLRRAYECLPSFFMKRGQTYVYVSCVIGRVDALLQLCLRLDCESIASAAKPVHDADRAFLHQSIADRVQLPPTYNMTIVKYEPDGSCLVLKYGTHLVQYETSDHKVNVVESNHVIIPSCVGVLLSSAQISTSRRTTIGDDKMAFMSRYIDEAMSSARRISSSQDAYGFEEILYLTRGNPGAYDLLNLTYETHIRNMIEQGSYYPFCLMGHFIRSVISSQEYMQSFLYSYQKEAIASSGLVQASHLREHWTEDCIRALETLKRDQLPTATILEITTAFNRMMYTNLKTRRMTDMNLNTTLTSHRNEFAIVLCPVPPQRTIDMIKKWIREVATNLPRVVVITKDRTNGTSSREILPYNDAGVWTGVSIPATDAAAASYDANDAAECIRRASNVPWAPNSRARIVLVATSSRLCSRSEVFMELPRLAATTNGLCIVSSEPFTFNDEFIPRMFYDGINKCKMRIASPENMIVRVWDLSSIAFDQTDELGRPPAAGSSLSSAAASLKRGESSSSSSAAAGSSLSSAAGSSSSSAAAASLRRGESSSSSSAAAGSSLSSAAGSSSSSAAGSSSSSSSFARTRLLNNYPSSEDEYETYDEYMPLHGFGSLPPYRRRPLRNPDPYFIGRSCLSIDRLPFPNTGPERATRAELTDALSYLCTTGMQTCMDYNMLKKWIFEGDLDSLVYRHGGDAVIRDSASLRAIWENHVHVLKLLWHRMAPGPYSVRILSPVALRLCRKEIVEFIADHLEVERDNPQIDLRLLVIGGYGKQEEKVDYSDLIRRVIRKYRFRNQTIAESIAHSIKRSRRVALQYLIQYVKDTRDVRFYTDDRSYIDEEMPILTSLNWTEEERDLNALLIERTIRA